MEAILDQLRILLRTAIDESRDPALRGDNARIRALAAAVAGCFAELLAEIRGGATSPDAALAALKADLLRDLEALPPELKKLDHDWNWAGLKKGTPRFGAPIVGFHIARRLAKELAELALQVARHRHVGPCDCAVRIALARQDTPGSQRLRKLGAARDAYYVGDEYICDDCGTRWNCFIGDDDFGRDFWEPVKP